VLKISHAKFAILFFVQCSYIGVVRNKRSQRSTDQLKGDHPMFEVLKSRISNWKRYNRTVTELQALTNRELADLGIARGDIQRVAREAARG
jgi:uncharacterized protein YjiS (DUF1127 family)